MMTRRNGWTSDGSAGSMSTLGAVAGLEIGEY